MTKSTFPSQFDDIKEARITDPTTLLKRYITSLPPSVAAAVKQLVSELRAKNVADYELCVTIGIHDDMSFNAAAIAAESSSRITTKPHDDGVHNNIGGINRLINNNSNVTYQPSQSVKKLSKIKPEDIEFTAKPIASQTPFHKNGIFTASSDDPMSSVKSMDFFGRDVRPINLIATSTSSQQFSHSQSEQKNEIQNEIFYNLSNTEVSSSRPQSSSNQNTTQNTSIETDQNPSKQKSFFETFKSSFTENAAKKAAQAANNSTAKNSMKIASDPAEDFIFLDPPIESPRSQKSTEKICTDTSMVQKLPIATHNPTQKKSSIGKASAAHVPTEMTFEKLNGNVSDNVFYKTVNRGQDSTIGEDTTKSTFVATKPVSSNTPIPGLFKSNFSSNTASISSPSFVIQKSQSSGSNTKSKVAKKALTKNVIHNVTSVSGKESITDQAESDEEVFGFTRNLKNNLLRDLNQANSVFSKESISIIPLTEKDSGTHLKEKSAVSINVAEKSSVSTNVAKKSPTRSKEKSLPEKAPFVIIPKSEKVGVPEDFTISKPTHEIIEISSSSESSCESASDMELDSPEKVISDLLPLPKDITDSSATNLHTSAPAPPSEISTSSSLHEVTTKPSNSSIVRNQMILEAISAVSEGKKAAEVSLLNLQNERRTLDLNIKSLQDQLQKALDQSKKLEASELALVESMNPSLVMSPIKGKNMEQKSVLDAKRNFLVETSENDMAKKAKVVPDDNGTPFMTSHIELDTILDGGSKNTLHSKKDSVTYTEENASQLKIIDDNEESLIVTSVNNSRSASESEELSSSDASGDDFEINRKNDNNHQAKEASFKLDADKIAGSETQTEVDRTLDSISEIRARLLKSKGSKSKVVETEGFTTLSAEEGEIEDEVEDKNVVPEVISSPIIKKAPVRYEPYAKQTSYHSNSRQSGAPTYYPAPVTGSTRPLQKHRHRPSSLSMENNTPSSQNALLIQQNVGLSNPQLFGSNADAATIARAQLLSNVVQMHQQQQQQQANLTQAILMSMQLGALGQVSGQQQLGSISGASQHQFSGIQIPVPQNISQLPQQQFPNMNQQPFQPYALSTQRAPLPVPQQSFGNTSNPFSILAGNTDLLNMFLQNQQQQPR